jgi:hypothetical protein
MKKNEKEKGKKRRRGQPIYPSPLTFRFISQTPNPLSSAAAPLSLFLVLHYRSASAPLCLLLPSLLQMCCSAWLIDGGTEGLWTLQLDGGTEEARCCRSAPIGGTWPQPAQAATAGGQQLLPSVRENASTRASCGFWFPSRSPAGESPARPLPPARSVSPANPISLSFPRRFQSFSGIFPPPRTEASP